LKNIPGFTYDLLSEQHTTTGYVLEIDNAFAHLRCSTQFIMKKVLFFRLVLTLHLHQYRVGRVKRKKFELYKTYYLRWRAFCLRNMDERFHHLFTCVVAGPTNCGKTEFVAKFIQHVKQMMTPTPQRIVRCYGSGILYPPVTDCKTAYRLSNTLPAQRLRHWKFITEGKIFYVISIFSAIFVV